MLKSAGRHRSDGTPPRPSGPNRWAIAAVAAIVLGVAGGAFYLGQDDSPAGSPRTTQSTDVDGSTSSSSSTSQPTAPGALATGRVTSSAPSTLPEPCPMATCLELTVACPDLPDTTAVVALNPPSGPPRGFIAFFSGGPGRGWWANQKNQADAAIMTDLGDAGLEVGMVRWVEGWARVNGTEGNGFASVACRPATVVQWLHDQRYVPMGLTPAPGTCGFCITGNSGGSSQAAYSLTHYGLDTIVDAAILTSGPPHAALAKGCLQAPGDEAYWYDTNNLREIDSAYAGGAGGGPCARHDPTMADQWERDGVDTGGSDYRYDTTRVAVIVGSNDRTIAPIHAMDFVAKLRASGSPWVTDATAEGMSHGVTSGPEGSRLLLEAVLGAP